MAYERILVPLDGSPLAEAVLPEATTVARQFGAKLILLRVIPTLDEIAREVTPAAGNLVAADLGLEMARDRHASQRASAEAYLEVIRQSLSEQGFEVETSIEEGAPGLMIVTAAREKGVQLIALSTHGRTGLKRSLAGSVSDEVLRTAKLPILLIRPVERA